MPTGSVAQPESDILPNRSAVDFRKQYFPPRVSRSGISKEMLMLILCTGLGSPPFPRTGRFRVDKHVSGTDIALAADATVWLQVQARNDFATISPSRGVLYLPWEGHGASLMSSSHSLPLPSGSFLSCLINCPLLQFEPLTFQ